MCTLPIVCTSYSDRDGQRASIVERWIALAAHSLGRIDVSASAEQIDSGSFPAEVSALETDARAMTHLIEESETLGVNAELPRLIKAMADRSIAAGHGGEQYPVLIEEFGKPA